jgi:hypothetical protein
MGQKLVKDLGLTELVVRTRTFFYLRNCAKRLQYDDLSDDKMCKNDMSDDRLLIRTHNEDSSRVDNGVEIGEILTRFFLCCHPHVDLARAKRVSWRINVKDLEWCIHFGKYGL